MSEEFKYGFSKDKLPKAFSYPLKRSLLDAALGEASVRDAVYSVRYVFGRGTGPTTLDAMFVPESSPHAHDSVRGRSLITVWAVPNEERKACEDLLVADGLPKLCHWLSKSLNAGNVWRGTAHDLALVARDGVLKLRES
jgi:hypothetical protein